MPVKPSINVSDVCLLLARNTEGFCESLSFPLSIALSLSRSFCLVDLTSLSLSLFLLSPTLSFLLPGLPGLTSLFLRSEM